MELENKMNEKKNNNNKNTKKLKNVVVRFVPLRQVNKLCFFYDQMK